MSNDGTLTYTICNTPAIDAIVNTTPAAAIQSIRQLDDEAVAALVSLADQGAACGAADPATAEKLATLGALGRYVHNERGGRNAYRWKRVEDAMSGRSGFMGLGCNCQAEQALGELGSWFSSAVRAIAPIATPIVTAINPAIGAALAVASEGLYRGSITGAVPGGGGGAAPVQTATANAGGVALPGFVGPVSVPSSAIPGLRPASTTPLPSSPLPSSTPKKSSNGLLWGALAVGGLLLLASRKKGR